MRVLVLNSGSSSQKSCLYELAGGLPDDPPVPRWEARIEWTALGDHAGLTVHRDGSLALQERVVIGSRAQAIAHLLGTLWSGPAEVLAAPSEIDAVGHRIVHGGVEYCEPTLITPEVKAAIRRMAEFAPLHNCAELAGIETVERMLGNVPQVAVFDTAFHRHLPAEAEVYPGPYEWLEQGIRRYGFHGINHQYCAERAARILARDLASLRLISCHLGNGCSLAAIRHGRSVDTTMGFTPLEGLMMGTRSGSLDPGILIYLLRHKGYSAEKLDQLLNHEAGLLGVSGISSDMRKILEAMAQGHPRARLAFDIFVHRLRSAIGAMLAVLGGVDALIFTGGIGENSAVVREAACRKFEFLSLKIDPEKNAASPLDQDIAAGDSAVRVLIIRAQEDWAIARECWQLVPKRVGTPGPAGPSG